MRLGLQVRQRQKGGGGLERLRGSWTRWEGERDGGAGVIAVEGAGNGIMVKEQRGERMLSERERK